MLDPMPASENDINDALAQERIAEMTGKTLWLDAVLARLIDGGITASEAETLRTLDDTAVNGVQWAKGGIESITTPFEAREAVREIVACLRRNAPPVS